MIHTVVYSLHDLLPYVNWNYFFHAWGIAPRFVQIADVHDCPVCRRAWVESMGADDRQQAVEAEKLHREAVALVRELDGQYAVSARFGLFPAYSEGDDVIVLAPEAENDGQIKQKGKCTEKTVRLPFLRQQKMQHPENAFLCLADFVAPRGIYSHLLTDFPDFPRDKAQPRGMALGMFATAVDARMEQLFPDDDYRRMLVQTISDRMAEAAAEKMHEDIRRIYWGYSPEERFTPKELFAEKYEGRRPSVGYPSIPDQSMNFLIDELIGMKAIGIELTSNGMMQPHAAVSGFLFDHPAARHFAVGPIDEEQCLDYSGRRGLPEKVMRKYLAANMKA